MEVFVYGTLTDPERAASALDACSYRGAAVLDGLHRVEGSYPTLAPGGRVEGRLLDTTDLDALDRYEGVGRGLYVRVSVPLVTERSRPTSEEQRVAAYVGNPDELAVGESVSWPGPGPFAERVERYVREASVCVRRA